MQPAGGLSQPQAHKGGDSDPHLEVASLVKGPLGELHRKLVVTSKSAGGQEGRSEEPELLGSAKQ